MTYTLLYPELVVGCADSVDEDDSDEDDSDEDEDEEDDDSAEEDVCEDDSEDCVVDSGAAVDCPPPPPNTPMGPVSVVLNWPAKDVADEYLCKEGYLRRIQHKDDGYSRRSGLRGVTLGDE